MAATYKAYRAVDVSRYQGDIDYAAMRKAGIRAVIIRVGLGGMIDSKLYRNFEYAKKAGMIVGAYYVPYVITTKGVSNASLRTDAAYCASQCAEWLDGYRLDLPVFVDWEYANDDTFTEQSGMLLTVSGRTLFVQTVAEQIRKKGLAVGIYTNPDYLTSKFTANAFSKYPLFLAQWVKHGTTASAGSVPTRYGMPMLWQYDYGRVSGCDYDIDLDFYYVKN